MKINENLPIVSIVIPVYNGEKYLDNLFDCLSNQTYSNLDIICVDDFSTDDSYKMIQDFQKKDNRFRALQRSTKGGTAVKGQEFALPYCRGDYYFFLSQDDFIDLDLVEKCVDVAQKQKADVVLPNMILYHSEKKDCKEGAYPLNNDYTQILDPKSAFLLSLHWNIHGFALVDMNLVRQIGIKAEYYNSCEYYMRKLYLYANKIAFCNTNFYYRQDNQDAITKSIKYFHIDVLTTDYMLYLLLKENDFAEKDVKKRRDELVHSCTVWWNIIKSNNFSGNEKKYMYRALLTIRIKLLVEQVLYRLKKVF